MSEENPTPEASSGIPSPQIQNNTNLPEESKGMRQVDLISQQAFSAKKTRLFSNILDDSPSMPPPHHQVDLVTKVPILATLMIFQGLLSAAMGLVAFINLAQISVSNGVLNKDITLSIIPLVSSGLQVYAGIRNLKYRDRTLGMMALIAGMVIIPFYVACAPTAIALLTFGLIVYSDKNVRLTFNEHKPETYTQIMQSFTSSFWQNRRNKILSLVGLAVIEFILTLPWSIFIVMVPFDFPKGLLFWVQKINPDIQPNQFLNIGWLSYIGLAVGIVLSNRKKLVQVLFIILIFLLILNAGGCQLINQPHTK